jgi:putative transposase
VPCGLSLLNIRSNDTVFAETANAGAMIAYASLAEVAGIVTPETVLWWHRKLVAEKYDGTDQRRPGRPRTASQIESLVVRMAAESRDWWVSSYPGWPVESGISHRARNGWLKSCRDTGSNRLPSGNARPTWREFLKRWGEIVAADLFAMKVWTRRGLRLFIVLFFIELSTRKVKIGGIAVSPNGLWMSQIGRKLTKAGNGILKR